MSLEKEPKTWNYKTQPKTKELPEYVKRNLEAEHNKKDVRLNYNVTPRMKHHPRYQVHDRPDSQEGPKGF